MYREQKVTFHSAAGATATGTVLNCAGMSSLVVQISGSFSATVTWQASVDGTNYIAIQAENMASGAVATTATAAGLYRLSVAGLRLFRANMTWASGTSITATGLASAAPVGLTLADIDVVGQEDVNVAQVGGETVTADATGRTPVSLYAKASAAGDKEVLVDSSGHLQIDVLSLSALPTGTNVIGDVGYEGYTTAKSGLITVGTAGTAVVGTTEAGNLFGIKAHPDNTDAVWVGNDGASDVTNANGFPLNPGETIVLNMANLNQVYFDADVSGEKACWIKLA